MCTLRVTTGPWRGVLSNTLMSWQLAHHHFITSLRRRVPRLSARVLGVKFGVSACHIMCPSVARHRVGRRPVVIGHMDRGTHKVSPPTPKLSHKRDHIVGSPRGWSNCLPVVGAAAPACLGNSGPYDNLMARDCRLL